MEGGLRAQKVCVPTNRPPFSGSFHIFRFSPEAHFLMLCGVGGWDGDKIPRRPTPPPLPQGCIRREGASGVDPEAVRQAVAGGCQSGWGGYKCH